jgi:hypothetical protein
MGVRCPGRLAHARWQEDDAQGAPRRVAVCEQRSFHRFPRADDPAAPREYAVASPRTIAPRGLTRPQNAIALPWGTSLSGHRHRRKGPLRDLLQTNYRPCARLVVSLRRRGAGYEGTAEAAGAGEGAVTWSMRIPASIASGPSSTCSSDLGAGLRRLAFRGKADPGRASTTADRPSPLARRRSLNARRDAASLPAKVKPRRGPSGSASRLVVGSRDSSRPAFGLPLPRLDFSRAAWFSLDLEGRSGSPAASRFLSLSGASSSVRRDLSEPSFRAAMRYFGGCLLAEVGPLPGAQ